MNTKTRDAISTTITVAIIVVIIVIAGVAAYFVFLPTSTSTTTNSSSQQTTTTSSSGQHTTTTSSSGGLYGPTNSSVLVDDSGAGSTPPAAYDSMDPQYAFYSQDVGMLNAVYQNLVELNGSSGTSFQYVLASSANVNVNGGMTNTFNLRSDVTFSNGDKFSSADVWFSIERDLFMNAPSFIAGFNWNAILYNISSNSQFAAPDEYSDNYCWNTAGIGATAGVADAIAHVTGLAVNLETKQSCDQLASVLSQMLSNFNPSNATQAAIMAYPNQAVVSPNATSFVSNYLHPLGVFGLQLWSGFDGQNVVDPAQIDANGGVVNNTLNSYVNLHGAIGTGPYEVVSVGAGLAPVVFDAVPHYWAASDPAVSGNKSLTNAQPAKIPVIVYEVAPTDTTLIQNFASNKAQLSVESISEFGQMYDAFHSHHPSFTFNQVLCTTACGAFPFGLYWLMNDHYAPTNTTAFRLGWESAINYTQYLAPDIYNGTAYYGYNVGALTPAFGQAYYNPANLSPFKENTTRAFNYFNQAGLEQHWFTVVPSTFTLDNGTTIQAGTTIGDSSGQQLQPLKIYYTVPLLTQFAGQLEGIIQNLGVFGISATTVGVTSAEANILTSQPATFPQVFVIGWGPDYQDPFLAMYEPLLLPSPYNGWYTNQTVINDVNSCLFPTGAQIQSCSIKLELDAYQNGILPQRADQITFDYFIQPYVKGFSNNPFVGYWYNQLYYSPQST
jgi:peptide/nickel transport system substrate-binding protein